MSQQDASRRLLFSHQRMVADLLKLVDEEWTREVHFDSLEQVQSSHASSSLQIRREDMVWKALKGPQKELVYIPLEYQSTVQRWMGLRWISYLGLFNQSLVKGRSLKHPGQLPPSFPTVVYNGSRPWNAPLDASGLYGKLTGGLEKYALQLRYYLLEERLFRPKELEGQRNAVACMLRLENSRHPDDFKKAIADSVRWFPGEQYQELRRDFACWILQVLIPRSLPGQAVTQQVEDLTEVEAMLEEKIPTWTEIWKAEGIREGRRQGRRQGKREGCRQGEATMLTRLLESKFGELGNPTRRQIAQADLETLRRWAGRILEAKSLEQVLGDVPA